MENENGKKCEHEAEATIRNFDRLEREMLQRLLWQSLNNNCPDIELLDEGMGDELAARLHRISEDIATFEASPYVRILLNCDVENEDPGQFERFAMWMRAVDTLIYPSKCNFQIYKKIE